MEASTLKVEKEDYLPSNPNGISWETCGDKFKKPLFATISAGQVLKEYYACPRCLSKIVTVDVKEPKKEKEILKEEATKEVINKIEERKEEIPGCKNTLGYLKKRPKNTPIPEECFTCNKMIDCMAY